MTFSFVSTNGELLVAGVPGEAKLRQVLTYLIRHSSKMPLLGVFGMRQDSPGKANKEEEKEDRHHHHHHHHHQRHH